MNGNFLTGKKKPTEVGKHTTQAIIEEIREDCTAGGAGSARCVVAGIEPASIGALPIVLRAATHETSINHGHLFTSSPLSFTTPESALIETLRLAPHGLGTQSMRLPVVLRTLPGSQTLTPQRLTALMETLKPRLHHFLSSRLCHQEGQKDKPGYNRRYRHMMHWRIHHIAEP